MDYLRYFWLALLVLAGGCHLLGALLAARERYGRLRLGRLLLWPGGTTLVWYGRQLRERGAAALRHSAGVLLLTISYALVIAILLVAVLATLASRLTLVS